MANAQASAGVRTTHNLHSSFWLCGTSDAFVRRRRDMWAAICMQDTGTHKHQSCSCAHVYDRSSIIG